MAGGECYMFGEFVLNVSERRLSRAGQLLPLAPKAHDVLAALLRGAGRLVTKSELLSQVWPESFVEEGILAVHISALRKALAESEGGRRYIETVSRSGYRFIAPVTQPGRSQAALPERWSIAVLPARPLSTEVLSGRDVATGLTIADALIDRLGRWNRILVRPTRAVHRYTNATEDTASVGQSLRVDAVLESSFLRTAGQVQLSARLVRSRDGACLWRGEFCEPAAGIQAIADAVSGSVAAHLGFRAPDEGAPGRGNEARAKPVRLRQPFPPEVYELFGRGRSHLLAGSMFEVPKAIEAFRAATTLAPDYALAHAGLALAHCAEAELRVRPQGEAFSDARAAALRGLAMDDACADAQVALGSVLFLSDWNWIGAERSLERALALHPNHTEGYLMYGRLLEAVGRLEEGLEMKLGALERDPFSPLVHLQIAMSYFHQRRYEDSIEWANKALELDPRHPHAREHIAGAYWKKGDFDRWMAENIRHAESHGVPPEALERLRQAYTAGGRAGVGRLILQQAASRPQGFPDIQLAILYGEAGDMDAAFLHLNRALDSHDPAIVHLAVGPQWDVLRADRSRFGQCLERMGLRRAYGRSVHRGSASAFQAGRDGQLTGTGLIRTNLPELYLRSSGRRHFGGSTIRPSSRYGTLLEIGTTAAGFCAQSWREWWPACASPTCAHP